jgi:hypothetical protein
MTSITDKQRYLVRVWEIKNYQIIDAWYLKDTCYPGTMVFENLQQARDAAKEISYISHDSNKNKIEISAFPTPFRE